MRIEHIGEATLYLGDCLEVLPTLPKVDAVITDPPYNVSLKGGRQDTTVRKRITEIRSDGSKSYREVVRDFGKWDHGWEPEPFLDGVCAMLAPGGALIAFTSEFLLSNYLQSGLDHRAMLYWRKTNPAPNFAKQIVRSVEMAVWQTNGGQWTFNAGGYRPNVWEGPTISGWICENTPEEREHPTQKPEWLMRELVNVFSRTTVLDPFMGSGTTGVACAQIGRKFIGVEIEPRYFDIACRRIERAYAQGKLFEHQGLSTEQLELDGRM